MLIIAGTHATDPKPGPSVPPPLTHAVSVRPVTLGGERAYVLVLTAMATGEQEIGVTFPDGQTYDFIIMQDGREIWRWSRRRAFHQAVQQRSFRPGEMLLFVEVWNGQDEFGNPVRGPVDVYAVLTTDPPIKSGPVRLDLD
ncbi:MAG: hypothetical protein H0Z37_04425 [Firmicutes bacterium]|nr:hypothetical protein [Bacillota bacterium]